MGRVTGVGLATGSGCRGCPPACLVILPFHDETGRTGPYTRRVIDHDHFQRARSVHVGRSARTSSIRVGGLPCDPTPGPDAKAPLTVRGHLDASTDPEEIRYWWDEVPTAMIGAKVPDTLLVIDIDPRNGGSVDGLAAVVGPLPATLTAWSGRNDGGRHLYFHRPAGPLTSTKLRQQAPGIDLKVNGYCIVPPSIHPATGSPYWWDTHPVADMPHGLRELLRPVPRVPKKARARRQAHEWRRAPQGC
jgi:hypothetical protein